MRTFLDNMNSIKVMHLYKQNTKNNKYINREGEKTKDFEI